MAWVAVQALVIEKMIFATMCKLRKQLQYAMIKTVYFAEI